MREVLLLIIVCCLLVGCSKDKDEKIIQTTSEDTTIDNNGDIVLKANKDPDVLSKEKLSFTLLNVQTEMDYDNISISIEKELFSLEENDAIKCKIINKNIGKGFYYYYIPFVEYYNNNEWVRLSYYPPETEYDEQWYFCAVEGNDNMEYSTITTFYPQYVREELVEGRYRLVVFVGTNKYYAEFNLK